MSCKIHPYDIHYLTKRLNELNEAPDHIRFKDHSGEMMLVYNQCDPRENDDE